MDDSSGFRTFSSGATATVSWTDGRALVAMTGEFDECFAPSGTAIIDLVADHGRPVDVDLSGLTLLSAAGVSWLLRLYGSVEVEVRVVAASDHVTEVLALCQVPTRSTDVVRPTQDTGQPA